MVTRNGNPALRMMLLALTLLVTPDGRDVSKWGHRRPGCRRC